MSKAQDVIRVTIASAHNESRDDNQDCEYRLDLLFHEHVKTHCTFCFNVEMPILQVTAEQSSNL